MENTVSKNKILTALAAGAVIVVLMGLAFLPLSNRADTDALAAGREVKGDAVQALYDCAEYAERNGFNAELTGTVKARVVGVPYTLNVRGERRVNGAEFASVRESVSPAVKRGYKTECVEGEYRVYRGTFDKATGEFVYGTPETIDKTSFTATYGDPSALFRYNIDGNILSAERVGENVYRYTLDPVAADSCKAEVGMLAKCKTPPEYNSIELTLITDGTRAVKISAVEKFRLDKLGGVDCVAEYEENFK